MANVDFIDNRMKVENALDKAILAYLDEASGELEAQTKREQTRVDTGQTKGAWAHQVDEDKQEAVVGSPLENAIWEEYGTGEYALHGDGRKGGWFYEDEEGNGHFTHGKKPLRPLQHAFDKTKDKIIKRLGSILGETFSE